MGEVAMPAHPSLSASDAQQMVTYILSLANKTAVKKSLPPSGSITPPADTKPENVLVLTASYTDKGGNNIKALTGRSTVSLNGPEVRFTGKEEVKDFTFYTGGNQTALLLPAAEGWFALNNIDLTGIRSLNLTIGWQDAPKNSFNFEARLDTPDGTLLGKGTMPPPVSKNQQGGLAKLAINPVTDDKMHKIYIIYKGQEKVVAGIRSVQFSSK